MPQELTIVELPLPFGLGTVSCYLLRTAAGFVLVDTGGANARRALCRELASAGCTPGSLQLVLLTHGDLDHIGNAAYLRRAFSARIAMHADDAAMPERGDMFVNRKQPSRFIRALLPVLSGFGKSDRFTPDVLLDEGTDLCALGLQARVILLPGHSRGSLGILTADGALFCGDLLENTRGPALGSLMDDPAAARSSVASLWGLDISMVYPGHGRPFALERLARTEA